MFGEMVGNGCLVGHQGLFLGRQGPESIMFGLGPLLGDRFVVTGIGRLLFGRPIGIIGDGCQKSSRRTQILGYGLEGFFLCQGGFLAEGLSQFLRFRQGPLGFLVEFIGVSEGRLHGGGIHGIHVLGQLCDGGIEFLARLGEKIFHIPFLDSVISDDFLCFRQRILDGLRVLLVKIRMLCEIQDGQLVRHGLVLLPQAGEFGHLCRRRRLERVELLAQVRFRLGLGGQLLPQGIGDLAKLGEILSGRLGSIVCQFDLRFRKIVNGNLWGLILHGSRHLQHSFYFLFVRFLDGFRLGLSLRFQLGCLFRGSLRRGGLGIYIPDQLAGRLGMIFRIEWFLRIGRNFGSRRRSLSPDYVGSFGRRSV